MHKARASTLLRRPANGDTHKGPEEEIDDLEIAFNDERLVADAGLVLPATLCDRLGAAQLIDGLVERPGDPAIGAAAGAKALSIVFAMLAGAGGVEQVG